MYRGWICEMPLVLVKGLFEGALLLVMLAGIPSRDSLENLEIYLLSCYPFAGRSWANRGTTPSNQASIMSLASSSVFFPDFFLKKSSNPLIHEKSTYKISNLQNSQGFLVGGWTNSSEKHARQIGSFPQILGVKIKNMWVATNQLQSQPSKNPPVRFFDPKHCSNLATHRP